MVIGLLVLWKRWRIWYYKHADDFFLGSFLSCTLGGKKTVKSNDIGFECRGTNVYWMRALSGKMFELFHIRTEHY